MRKIWFLAAVFLLSVTGCGTVEETETGDQAAAQAEETAEEEEGTMEEDRSFTIDGVQIQLPVDYQVLNGAGWSFSDSTKAEEVLEAGTYRLDSIELENEAYPQVILRAAFINQGKETAPLTECQMYGFAISNVTYDRTYDSYPDIALAGGIHFGSNAGEVAAVYGDPKETIEGAFDTSYFYQSGLTAMEFGIHDTFGVDRIQLYHLPISGRLVQ